MSTIIITESDLTSALRTVLGLGSPSVVEVTTKRGGKRGDKELAAAWQAKFGEDVNKVAQRSAAILVAAGNIVADQASNCQKALLYRMRNKGMDQYAAVADYMGN